MIRVFENNTLGLVLASACGVMVLGCLGLVLLWAMSPGTDIGEGESEEGTVSASVATLQSTGPLEQYAVVSERPVFNEDRRPAPVLDEEDGGDDEGWDDVVVGAPDVQLAGIIITPSLKMATLKSPDHPQSLVAFEGQPLEGDFGTWQVSRIDERMVTLSSADGEEMQLELQVHDTEISEPPEVTKVAQRTGPAVSGDEGEAPVESVQTADETLSRADQIRQRIEERREELRRAAEAEQEGQAANYRDAIQNLINESRRDAEELAREEAKAQDEGQ